MNPLLFFLPILLGILSIGLSLAGLIMIPIKGLYISGIGILLGIFGLGLGLINRLKIKNLDRVVKKQPIVHSGIILTILGILLNSVTGGMILTGQYTTKRRISKVKANHLSLATALESYYVDNCIYPRADFDDNDNPVIPHVLTTPVVYAPCGMGKTTTMVLITQCEIIQDPFNKYGKGRYGYGGGPVEGCGPKCTWPGAGWIVTSYGPDRINGNYNRTGIRKINHFKAWSDTELGFNLMGSDLTYDPTNGIRSPGDIWRRGP